MNSDDIALAVMNGLVFMLVWAVLNLLLDSHQPTLLAGLTYAAGSWVGRTSTRQRLTK